jgi:hypothetical protein
MTIGTSTELLTFSELADQWLIAYACTFSSMPLPTLFIVGHCLEAFCKSAILKNDPSINVSGGKYGHDVEFMLTEIKSKCGILSSVSFLPDVESRFMTGGLIPMSLTSDPSYLHYIANQELYWTAKYQKELKYLGTPGRNMPVQYAVLVMERNPYWIPILKELRQYVRSGLTGESQTILTFRAKANVMPAAMQFVNAVVS